MEVGVSMVMKNQNGSIKLSVTECSCYMEDLDITLNGGASWFYQVYVVLDLLYMHDVVNSFEGALSKSDFSFVSKKWKSCTYLCISTSFYFHLLLQ